MPETTAVRIPATLLKELLAEIERRAPAKSFGYLISDVDSYSARDFVLFEDNIRNGSEWRETFEAYGDYYVEHRDAGFVASPEEAWRRQKEIWARNMFEVGIFHSHHRHPADFSRIDYEMHSQRFENLWHMIVSVRNPEQPVVRVFAPAGRDVRELPVVVTDEGECSTASPNGRTPHELFEGRRRDEAIAWACNVLRVDDARRPVWPDLLEVWRAVDAVLRSGDPELIAGLLQEGFLQGAEERYQSFVAPGMAQIPATTFEMGRAPGTDGGFHGECPAHIVKLSPFSMSWFAVTGELYSRFAPDRANRATRHLPTCDVTWYEAALFALWVGCRLPTEAQWELACSGGSTGEWCCARQEDLPRYGWYCKNSGGEIHPVGMLSANQFGLCDLHGNVWEWCRDDFDRDFYRHSPLIDPMNGGSGRGIRVTRGGSMNGHAEMCRSRYRSHEAAGFRARDLGFRLVREHGTGRNRHPW